MAEGTSRPPGGGAGRGARADGAPSAGAASPRVRTGAAARIGARELALLAAALGLACGYLPLLGVDPLGPDSELEGFEELFFSPVGSSPVLVFVGFAWIAAIRGPRLRALVGEAPRIAAGAGLAAGAVALCGWAHYVSATTLLVPSLCALLLAAALLLGGTRAARLALLPSLFLLFAHPLPAVLVNRIIYPLQRMHAEMSGALLRAGGWPALVSGDRIFTTESVFQVIESCSGLRGTLTILMTSILYVEIFGRRGRRAAAIVLASPLIGLVSNEIRILTIVANPYSGFSAVHTVQGLAVLVLGVLSLALIDALLGRVMAAPRAARARPAKGARRVPAAGVAVLAVSALTVVGLSGGVPRWTPEPAPEPRLTSLPPRHDGWQASGLHLDKEFLGSVALSEWVRRLYRRDGAEIDVFLGSNRRLGIGGFVSEKTAVLETGLSVVWRGREHLAPLGRDVQALVLATATGERQLVFHWYENVASFPSELIRSLLALDRGPFRREERALVVRLATPLAGRDTREEGAARLRAFVDSYAEPLRRLLGAGDATETARRPERSGEARRPDRASL